MPDTPPSKTHFENKVILATILLGFIGGVLLFFMKVPPVFMAIFLGSGIAALVYRFLGGTADASFVMGTLKLSGSIAILLGSAYYINDQLEKQLKPDSDSKPVTFTPRSNTWVAIDRASGEFLEIKVNETEQVLAKPTNNPLKNTPLKLKANGNKIWIHPEADDQFYYGQIEKTELKALNLYNSILSSGNYIVTDRLNINKQADLTPLPFLIKTTAYTNEYSHFQLIDPTTKEVKHTSQLYRRQFQLALIEGKNYLIGVVEVNHSPKIEGDPNSLEPYAKFVVAEIVAELK